MHAVDRTDRTSDYADIKCFEMTIHFMQSVNMFCARLVFVMDSCAKCPEETYKQQPSSNAERFGCRLDRQEQHEFSLSGGRGGGIKNKMSKK